mmetsp:Transcript_31724/g.48184  ORF Transcript_31724/g.48184 Transcript_31724/m.48184 type:complete len:93 (-) Transcript_31724:901-1179(-)
MPTFKANSTYVSKPRTFPVECCIINSPQDRDQNTFKYNRHRETNHDWNKAKNNWASYLIHEKKYSAGNYNDSEKYGGPCSPCHQTNNIRNTL